MYAGPAVPEVPWRIIIDGQTYAVGTAAPDQLVELAIGRLVADGVIAPAAASAPVTPIESGGVTDLAVDIDPALAAKAFSESRHRMEHGCGLRHCIDCAPELIARVSAARVPPADQLADALRQLFDSSRSQRGGVHAAGLFDGAALHHIVEDVSRHAAVDKVIGRAALAGYEPSRYGLVLTARISGEIALKAARSGIAWIASRSVPTTLAAEIADTACLPLIPRAANARTTRGAAHPDPADAR